MEEEVEKMEDFECKGQEAPIKWLWKRKEKENDRVMGIQFFKIGRWKREAGADILALGFFLKVHWYFYLFNYLFNSFVCFSLLVSLTKFIMYNHADRILFLIIHKIIINIW